MSSEQYSCILSDSNQCLTALYSFVCLGFLSFLIVTNQQAIILACSRNTPWILLVPGRSPFLVFRKSVKMCFLQSLHLKQLITQTPPDVHLVNKRPIINKTFILQTLFPMQCQTHFLNFFCLTINPLTYKDTWLLGGMGSYLLKLRQNVASSHHWSPSHCSPLLCLRPYFCNQMRVQGNWSNICCNPLILFKTVESIF